MKYIECPQVYNGNRKSLFIAGGITGCSNWQNNLVSLLKNENIVILNPRRKHFPTDNQNIDEEQIAWEYEHLKKASAVSFWFTEETLCPITLYELGKQSALNKPIFIGVHPNYQRKRDLEIQTRIIRPEIKIVYALEDLAGQIKEWSKNETKN
ncbi:MAG: nucleoside 2-deoxyribosyltransferase domain-containing protein [archaeon]|nr:nucleoside 2-deoxyribosyltransferase domain-containing protein [archaeon]